MNLLKITLSFLIGFLFFSASYAQVKAYGQKDFGDPAIELKPGKYAYKQLENRGLKTLGGLRIPIGCRVKLYSGENLQGEAKSYSKNNANINNTTPYSLKVTCGSVGAQPGFAIGASHEVGRKGDLIFVDVNVSDFNKVVSMQYSMNFDAKILRFEKVKNFRLKDLSKENFGLKQLHKGNILMAWYDPSVQGVNLPDGTNIYQLVFRVISDNTAKSKIRFSGKPLTIEVMRADGTPIYFNNVSGSFTIK